MTKTLALLLILASSIVNAQNLNDSLVAYYPFSGDFNDQSGNNNNFTPHGGVSFADDKWGNPASAAYFDGVNDWLEAAGIAKTTVGKEMTLSFYVRTLSSASQELISRSRYTYPPTQNYQYAIGINQGSLIAMPGANDGLFLSTNHTGGCNASPGLGQHYLFSSDLVQPSQWICIAITFDHGQKKFYFDGILKDSSYVTTGNSSSMDSCVDGTLRMGIWWEQGPLYYNGMMDEFRLYKRVLSATEIPQLCSQPVGVEELSNNSMQVIANAEARSFCIKSNISARSELTVFNSIGQAVQIDILDEHEKTVSLAHMPMGIYIVKIQTPAGTFVRKLFL